MGENWLRWYPPANAVILSQKGLSQENASKTPFTVCGGWRLVDTGLHNMSKGLSG